MTTPSQPQAFAGEGGPTSRKSPVDMVRHAEDRVRSSASAVGRRLERVSWLDVCAGATLGLGLGYLLFSRRTPQSLSEVMSDSVGPWASRRVRGAVDSVKRSKPLCGLSDTLERLRAS